MAGDANQRTLIDHPVVEGFRSSETASRVKGAESQEGATTARSQHSLSFSTTIGDGQALRHSSLKAPTSRRRRKTASLSACEHRTRDAMSAGGISLKMNSPVSSMMRSTGADSADSVVVAVPHVSGATIPPSPLSRPLSSTLFHSLPPVPLSSPLFPSFHSLPPPLLSARLFRQPLTPYNRRQFWSPCPVRGTMGPFWSPSSYQVFSTTSLRALLFYSGVAVGILAACCLVNRQCRQSVRLHAHSMRNAYERLPLIEDGRQYAHVPSVRGGFVRVPM